MKQEEESTTSLDVFNSFGGKFGAGNWLYAKPSGAKNVENIVYAPSQIHCHRTFVIRSVPPVDILLNRSLLGVLYSQQRPRSKDRERE